ncbi:hypothetical protein KUTeg_015753 [Tegillarca granosa]|uniref:Uncharacterized protein n=1 Tax=Tegillarca granosa TaxID=220873 RepID=A0ABQ9EN71_TEGGR|nr:hypothetical protein KUTeg_015753 [Tegillarca granosa]
MTINYFRKKENVNCHLLFEVLFEVLSCCKCSLLQDNNPDVRHWYLLIVAIVPIDRLNLELRWQHLQVLSPDRIYDDEW